MTILLRFPRSKSARCWILGDVDGPRSSSSDVTAGTPQIIASAAPFSLELVTVGEPWLWGDAFDGVVSLGRP
jgi:hypothetical protein